MLGEEEPRIRERVIREKAAHDDDDVLSNSVQLKEVFRHVNTCETARRFERDYKGHLENVHGLKVLDLGCGYGHQSLTLLNSGAFVEGIDISDRYIKACSEITKNAGYSTDRCRFQVMDAHRLEFDDEAFDLVVGRGILHHLDLEPALKEIYRVLKIGGRALFHEPLAQNPLLKIFRMMTPRARTQDERPLTRKDLSLIEATWRVESTYYGIVSAPVAMVTSIILRPFDNSVFHKMADRLDRWFNNAAVFHAYNQYVLLNLVREDKESETNDTLQNSGKIA